MWFPYGEIEHYMFTVRGTNSQYARSNKLNSTYLVPLKMVNVVSVYFLLLSLLTAADRKQYGSVLFHGTGLPIVSKRVHIGMGNQLFL